MENEYPIVHSPLEEQVTRDGVSVEVLIYRGEGDQDWILEVVDENGGSTVWDDPFPTDRAAHDAVLGAIAEEGIGAFVVPKRQVTH